MKRIEYSENRLKDGLARLKKTWKIPGMRSRAGVLTGIAAVFFASLIVFTSLARQSGEVHPASASPGGTASASSADASTASSASARTDTEMQKKGDILASIQPSILLKTTGCTYSYAEPAVFFSYDNGKSQSCFPSDWEPEIVYRSYESGAFCVSPDKTAVVCIRNNAVVIVYSDDKGKTWKSSAPIPPSQIPVEQSKTRYLEVLSPDELSAKIDFVSGKCGYLLLCGGWGMSQEQLHALFRTADGGKTWSYVDSDYQDSNYVTDMHFTDSRTGYICNSCAAAFRMIVYRTSDGGATWTACTPPFATDSEDSYEKYGSPVVFGPYFIGSKGYVLAYCQNASDAPATFLYCVSSDNGKTWKYAAAKQSFDSPPYWELYP